MKRIFLFLVCYTPLAVAFYAETEHVVLRSWQDDDVSKLYQILKDPEVHKHINSVGNSYESVKKFVADASAYIAQHQCGFYACEDKVSRELIGFAGLTYLRSISIPLKEPCLTVSVAIAPKYWGRGYANELVHELIRLAFERHNIQKFGACISLTNPRSAKFANRIAASYPAEVSVIHAQRNSFYFYTLSRDEYFKHVYKEKAD
jgi:RimJ/RimL family protein N-acetyltransferase